MTTAVGQAQLVPLIAIIPLIVGVVSALTAWSNLVSSKEQKISEFRHKWIGDVREAFAKFASRALTLARSVKSIYDEDKLAFGKYETHEKLAEDRRELWDAYMRLRLFWQPNKEFAALDREVQDIVDTFSIASNVDPAKLRIRIEVAQRLLGTAQKNAWNEVKRGEPAYVIVLWLSLVVLATCAVVASMLFFQWIKQL